MTQTIVITDATASDLTQALAHPVPPPTTTPPPSSGVTQPFVVDAQNPLATIVTGPDGPLLMLGYDPNTKTPWLYLRSYLQGDTTKGIYPGSFLSFQCFNRAGKMMGAVTMNAGLVDDTPGKEQGDLDIVMPVNGAGATQATFTFAGYYTTTASSSPPSVTYPPGLTCWPPDLLHLGTSTNRFAGAGLTILPVRPGMPPNANGCVDIGSGRYVPTYA